MPDDDYKGTAYPTQKERLSALFLYAGILVLLSICVTGEWFPSTSGKRLWFLSGIGFFFLTQLTAPWFRPPRNALVNAVTSALLFSTLDLAGVALLQEPLNIFRWIIIGIDIVTSICAITAMGLVDLDPSQHPIKKQTAVLGYRISDTLGKGEIVFTPPALVSILGYYQHAPMQQLWLLFAWVLMVAVRPVELVFRIVRELRLTSRTVNLHAVLGTITRVDNPNIIRVALTSPENWQPNTVSLVCLPDGRQVEALCLFSHLEEDQPVGTALCRKEANTPVDGLTPGTVYLGENCTDCTGILKELSGLDSGAHLLGFVVEDSNISAIKFEVSSDMKIEEGMLSFCRQGDQTVFYQILDARTAEESFGRNPRGKHIVTAAQLGCLHAEKGFAKYGWLPAMNCPVFVPTTPVEYKYTATREDEFVIGKVPSSEIAVRANFFDLLEYHTAILGVTGTGKTELAFDIIRKGLSLGTKVFCVDFTGEYKARLSDANPQLLGLDQKQAEELRSEALCRRHNAVRSARGEEEP